MKFLNLYNLILEELTDKQKKLIDKYTTKRSSDLSFGPIFKEERTYFPLNIVEVVNIEIPNEIENALDNAGFYITDYRAGIAMKKAKPDEQKDLRQIKIGKILSKLNKPELLKQFNERLGTSKKDIQNIQFEICVTHNPYDIAGMSTDRNWTSCMNLNDGAYKTTPLKQVLYGGMVAYLISDKDKNIEKPFARIAVKRFIISNANQDKFIFVAENRIYGDIALAEELNFYEKLVKILNKSNKLTTDITGKYLRKDGNSYSDTFNKNMYWLNEDNLDKQDKNTIITYIKNVISNNSLISCKILKYAFKTYPNTVLRLFKQINSDTTYNLKCYDIDKELIEILLNYNIILSAFKYTQLLSNQDAYDLILQHKNLVKIHELIMLFCENKYIKFTQNQLDKILNIIINEYTTSRLTIIRIFNLYKLNDNLLYKYLPLIIEQDNKIILKYKAFLISQDFPVDILIKYCDEDMLLYIYNNNKKLSKNNKEKLKNYLKIKER